MELVYLLYNQSFASQREINFSSKLIFREDQSSFIIDEKIGSEDFDDFFDNKISNITAFVGRNGTGKTTNICKPIMAPNWLTYDFIVFKNNGKLLVFINPRISKEIKNNTKYNIEKHLIKDLGPNDGGEEIYSKSNKELNELVRLYYSTSYSEAPFPTKSIFDDISTSGLISKEISLIRGKDSESRSEDFSSDSFINFKFNELTRQIDFLASDIGQDFSSNLNMNSKIGVNHLPKTTKNKNHLLEGIILFSQFEEINKEKIGDGLIDISKISGAPRIAIILWSYVYNLSSKIQQDYLEFLRRKQFDFHANEIKLDKEDVYLEGFIGPLITLINNNISDIEDHYVMKKGNNYLYSNTIFSIPVQIGKKFIEIYKKFLNDKISKYHFYWNISSGEYSYLSLFSRLYGLDSSNKYFLIVIDEGDTNFHPEWSRKYVKLLNEWIPKIMSGAKGIQLVLTTHSPYVLSDLPSSNVFTLNKVEGKIVVENPSNLTFGANIHDLLANDFFLENGFIGEFAKGKIQTVIDNLQMDKDFKPRKLIKKEEIIETIKIIGEPFLKDKLLEMYKQKFEEEDDLLNIEIEKLKSKIQRYESLKNKKNDTD
jgi:hypothetical protein